VLVVVEFGKTINKIPNLFVVGMEDMWTVSMDGNTIFIFVIMAMSCNVFVFS
jgi:hypothetical protein